MRMPQPSVTGRSTWRQAPDSEMSSRFATPRRFRPVWSRHWMSTRSAQSILGCIRLSIIIYTRLIGAEQGLFSALALDKIALSAL